LAFPIVQHVPLGKLLVILMNSTEDMAQLGAQVIELVIQHTPSITTFGEMSLNASFESSVFVTRIAAANLLTISKWCSILSQVDMLPTPA
jgi:hypothetical protein